MCCKKGVVGNVGKRWVQWLGELGGEGRGQW